MKQTSLCLKMSHFVFHFVPFWTPHKPFYSVQNRNCPIASLFVPNANPSENCPSQPQKILMRLDWRWY